MIHIVHLIVLSYTKFGERAIVLHSLSKEFGRRGFIISIGRKMSMSMFLPMNILEAEIVENPKSELWRVTKVNPLHTLGGIRSNIYKNSMTLFISEVLYRCIPEGSAEDGLFDWCTSSILSLDAMNEDFSNYHLRFLLELSVALGFSPSIDDLLPFAGDMSSDLQKFLDLPFAESMLIPLSGVRRNALAEVLIQYLSYHSQTRLNIQSLSVLRELFATP